MSVWWLSLSIFCFGFFVVLCVFGGVCERERFLFLFFKNEKNVMRDLKDKMKKNGKKQK